MTDLIEEAEAMAVALERSSVNVDKIADNVDEIYRKVTGEEPSLRCGNAGQGMREAAALIRRMIAQMRQDAEYVAIERGRIGKV